MDKKRNPPKNVWLIQWEEILMPNCNVWHTIGVSFGSKELALKEAKRFKSSPVDRIRIVNALEGVHPNFWEEWSV